MLNRRRMLALGGLTVGGAVGGLLLPKGTPGGTAAAPAVTDAVRPLTQHKMDGMPMGGLDVSGPSAESLAAVAPPVTPFSVPMPVPSQLRPYLRDGAADYYRLSVQPSDVEIFPGLRTPALTYGGTFLGPTIRARTGRTTRVTVTNRLADDTNVHLHGGHTPVASDGYPMDVIAPGQAYTYEYPNDQQGATLWYHDHVMGLESDHVYRGLHGFYLIDDPAEASLGLPSGEFDVPIMLRDAHFDEKGAFVFDIPRSTILANGKVQPYFQVAARKYRFRLLNGANERMLQLNLGGAQLLRIASDGGLLPAPVAETELSLASAERTEFVVDFSRYKVGTQLVLSDATAGPVLRFDVVRTAPDFSRVPDKLRALPALTKASVTREMVMSFDLTGVPLGLINGKPFDPNRIDFQVKRGSTEIWKIVNGDTAHPIDHTFHCHLVQFRVLEREGAPLLPQDAGRKDTVFLGSGKSVTVQATFTDFLGKYLYHCHFLEHSTSGMMGQFEIVA
ncbi:multicopper oxidase family protein [Amycolatopsis kentuckyensis]|uniref:multicopper oxidase family protein n=1 Tax=Amycolatopsis kentuckyensis TaxID=218823 RepID=UPI00356A6632